MFRILTLTALTLTLAMFSLGCDQQAQNREQAQKALDEVTALLERSNIRYIPAGVEQEQPWSQYRQTLLDDASKQLDSIISSAEQDQQLIARDLKAQIMLSTARMKADNAMADFRQLALRAAGTIDKLAAVNISNNRVETLNFTAQPAVKMLKDDITSLEAQRLQLVSKQGELQRKLQQAQDAAAEFREQSEQSNKRSDKLMQEAFVVSGKGKYDLEDQAAEAQLKAAALMNKRDDQLAQAQHLSTELALTTNALAHVGKRIAALQAASGETENRDRERQASRAASQDAVAATSTKLLASIDTLLQLFSEQVEQPLTDANQRFDAAAQLFAQAGQKARGVQSEALRGNELTARFDQAQTLTSHAIALGDMARFVRFVETSGQGLSTDQKAKLAAAFKQLQDRQGEVLAALEQGDEAVFATAQSMAGRLSEEETASRLTLLQQYRDMASMSRLQ